MPSFSVGVTKYLGLGTLQREKVYLTYNFEGLKVHSWASYFVASAEGLMADGFIIVGGHVENTTW